MLELMLSVAISVIVLGMAIVFVNQAIKYYKKATSTLALQSETQVFMEQVGEWVQQANRVEFSTSEDGDILLLWNIPSTTTGTEATTDEQTVTKRAIWHSTDGMLYTKSWTVSMDVVDGTATDATILTPSSDYLLGEYVTEFTVTITTSESGQSTQVSLAIGMESNGMSYTAKDSFTLRNLIQ